MNHARYYLNVETKHYVLKNYSTSVLYSTTKSAHPGLGTSFGQIELETLKNVIYRGSNPHTAFLHLINISLELFTLRD